MSPGRPPFALTRELPGRFGECELTHLERQVIDVDRARGQHRDYCRRLAALGCEVETLPAREALPDSIFVEDTAVVTDELAVLCRPGAASRRPEVETIAPELAERRPLARIEAPATLDGGDVLRLGRRVWVGRSSRSNAAGAEQLAAHLEPFGYRVSPVEVRGCLHLKTAATAVADDRLLVNPAWVDPDLFSGVDLIEVAPSEPFAANALRVNGAVVYPISFPTTASRLAGAGIDVEQVDVSELAKAEGGVTCCSLIFDR